jgi:hypothetical protein
MRGASDDLTSSGVCLSRNLFSLPSRWPMISTPGICGCHSRVQIMSAPWCVPIGIQLPQLASFAYLSNHAISYVTCIWNMTPAYYSYTTIVATRYIPSIWRKLHCVNRTPMWSQPTNHFKIAELNIEDIRRSGPGGWVHYQWQPTPNCRARLNSTLAESDPQLTREYSRGRILMSKWILYLLGQHLNPLAGFHVRALQEDAAGTGRDQGLMGEVINRKVGWRRRFRTLCGVGMIREHN